MNSLYEESENEKSKDRVVKHSFYTEKVKESETHNSIFKKIKNMLKKMLP